VLASFVAPPAVVHVAAVAVPVSVLVAVVRYRLYDIDVLVRRTVVYAVLLGGAALVYAAVVGWASALLGDDGGPVASFAGAVAVALAFAPAQARVRRGVDRLLFGERADPYRLLTDVDARVRAAASPAEALARWSTPSPPGCGCRVSPSRSTCRTAPRPARPSVGWTSAPTRCR
jgi:hypothetical protein